MIKLIVNDVELDLKSDTVVALTKKAAEIGNLQNRWSSYTNKFNVPATKKNRDALGLKQFQDASGSQYEYQNGKLISGGLEIASNVLVIIESVSQDITLTLRAGNGSLFDAMNKTKLSDLYWDDLNHRWHYDNIYTKRSATYTGGFCYPVFQAGNQSTTTNSIFSRSLIPFVFIKATFERIANYFGYTWSGDTYTLDMFQKLTYPITNLQIDSAFSNQYVFEGNLYYKNYSTFELLPNRINVKDLTVISDPKSKAKGFTMKVNTTGTSFVTQFGAGYSIPLKGLYEVQLTYNVSYQLSVSNLKSGLRIYIYNNVTKSTTLCGTVDFPVSNTTLQTASGTYTTKIDFTNEVYDDRWIMFVSVFTEDGFYTTFTFNSGALEIVSVESTETNFYSDIQMKYAQPDITVAKFIKEIANVFGAIYDVDEFKKTIDITRLDEIATNKSIAYDWSDKLDLNQDITVTYKLDGLAKSTILQWKDDLKYTKILTIDNDQLEEKAEYIKSDALYSDNANILLSFADLISIHLWNGDKIEMDGELRFSMTMLNPGSTQIKWAIGEGNSTSSSATYQMAYFDYTNSPYSLDWSYLYDTYFADLLDPMTDRLQVVECYMKLNDLDIQSFKFKIPVYVKRFNRYFFVNEISEYTGKTQSTKVLLVGI